MNPGTTSWTCPSCGAHNGAPHAPQPPASTPRRRTRATFPAAGRGPVIAVIAVIAAVLIIVLAVGVWAAFFHNSSPSGSAAALHKLCSDIPPDLGQRTRAVGRAETAMREDAKALLKAGDPSAAKRARDAANAFASLRHALVAHADTSAPTQKVGRAIANLPC
jgi:hypothetical protein